MKKTVCLFFAMLMLSLITSCGERPQINNDASIEGNHQDEGIENGQGIFNVKTDDEDVYGEHIVWGYYPGENGFVDCPITFDEAILEEKTVSVIVRNSGGVPDEPRNINVTFIRLRSGSNVTVPQNPESSNPAFSKAVCTGGGTLLENGSYDIALGGFGEMEHLEGFFSGKAEDIVSDPNSLLILNTTQFDTEYCFIMMESPTGTPPDISVEPNTSNHIISISAGYYHNGVLIDGDLYTWGGNSYGQLGDGTTEDRFEPRQVTGLPKIKSICFAGLRSAAIAENGDLYTWGVSEVGILHDSYENHVPIKTEGISNVKQIEINESNCIALDDRGDVYTWEEGVNSPQKIEGLSHVKKICIGFSNYMGAITDDGALYTWGSDYTANEHGELGRKGMSIYGGVSVMEPGLVESIPNIVDIDFGYEYSAAVTENGELYLWGDGDLAQVGDGTQSELHEPGLVPEIPPVKDVCLAKDTFAFITQDGMLFTWGQNKYGSLGLGSSRDVFYSSPERVPEVSNVKAVSMGTEHGIFITEDNTIYVFGDNSNCQLGKDDQFYSPIPIIVDFFSDILK